MTDGESIDRGPIARISLVVLAIAGIAISVTWLFAAEAERSLRSLEIAPISGAGAASVTAKARRLARRSSTLRAGNQPLLSRGVVAVRLGRWEEARRLFTEAASREPDTIEPLIGLLVVDRHFGYTAADEVQRRIMELNPLQGKGGSQ